MFGVWLENEKSWCVVSTNDSAGYKINEERATDALYWFRSNYPAFDYSIREHQANCLGNTSRCCDGRYDISVGDLKTLIDKLEL